MHTAALLLCLQAALVAALDVPALQARVTDRAALFSTQDTARLEHLLATYEQESGHQFAVLVVPSLEDEVLEAFSHRVMDAWKLGAKGRDDGLLLLIAVKERKARVEVGYGLEGAIPDVVAGRVVREQLAPAFATGAYAAGTEAALRALMDAAKQENTGQPVGGLPSKDNMGIALVVLMVLASLLRALPWPIRGTLGAVLGGVVGYFMGGVLTAMMGGVAGALAFLLGLNVLAGRRGGGWVSGGSSGGFSGGGGRSGGGGASGGW